MAKVIFWVIVVLVVGVIAYMTVSKIRQGCDGTYVAVSLTIYVLVGMLVVAAVFGAFTALVRTDIPYTVERKHVDHNGRPYVRIVREVPGWYPEHRSIQLVNYPTHAVTLSHPMSGACRKL